MISLHQVQDVVPITSYDTAGSFLLLGCNNGSIYYIGEWQALRVLLAWTSHCLSVPDERPVFTSPGVFYFSDMQKFPLRMKDNDLLVTELYRDPSNDAITALSVYLTPKTSECLAERASVPAGFRGTCVCRDSASVVLSLWEMPC